MLKHVIVIDSDSATVDLVKYCLGRIYPSIDIEHYSPALGFPAPELYVGRVDLILIEYQLNLPNENGLDWLRKFLGHSDSPPVMMLTGYGSENLAVKALKEGAADYLSKDDLSPKRLIASVNELIKARQAKKDEPGPRFDTYDDAQADAVFVSGASASIGSAATPSTGKETEESHVVSVPGYRVLRGIGQGGAANVYLAEREGDSLQVVLKVIPVGDDENPEKLKRFMREYKLLSKLNHPNVAKIFERGFASDLAYIAMEYFPGGDLKGRLNPKVDPKMALRYLRDITLGLEVVHNIGVIHRDLKPANILFRADDSLAITDFGIAKDVDNVAGALTGANSLLGTAYYVSPEMILCRELDKRSDFYSMGVMLYQMLTGLQPFRRNSLHAIFQAHLEAPIPQLPPPLSQFQALINGLLAKEPDDRFQTTDDLLAGIDWLAS